MTFTIYTIVFVIESGGYIHRERDLNIFMNPTVAVLAAVHPSFLFIMGLCIEYNV